MNSSKYVNLYEYLESNSKLKYIGNSNSSYRKYEFNHGLHLLLYNLDWHVMIMKSIIEKLNMSFEILKKFIINKY
jgi:hypothetical protein